MKNSFFEYEAISGKLKEAVKKNKDLQKFFTTDFEEIKATNYCGIINIEGEDFYILPKISKDENDTATDLQIFTYMLMNVFDINAKNEDLSGSKNEKHKLLEIFINFFSNMLFHELQRGIYKTYITEQDNLRALRGKYLPLQDITTNFTRDKIYCEYDEFSENNILNQFFLYAVKTISNYTQNKKILKIIERVLDEVDSRSFDTNKTEIFFNRLNERFENSFEVAKLLLNHFIPLFEKDRKSFAFLFDMNEIFEKFVGNVFKSVYPNAKTPNKCRVLNELCLKPDIILDELIIDCKYKRNNDEKAKRDDKYQMYVYGNNYDKKTMLLYPKHLQDLSCGEKLLGENEKKVSLKICSLDLFCVGLGYENYLTEMKQRVTLLI